MNFAPGKSPIIKNLIPGLTERGKIKIGRKGESRQTQSGGTFQLPQKLDHFLVTTLERGKDGNFVVDESIHGKLGAKPQRIPIMLMFDDLSLNFQCRYACYNGKTLFCSGDGEAAMQMQGQAPNQQRVQVQCPCHRQEPTYAGKDKCKINGTLSVLIDGAQSVGGVWKFRTTGYNSTVGILSSLTLIKSLTGGLLAGIPLAMTIQPKVCTSPVDGKSQTVYVVGVEYAGDMASLRKRSLLTATENAQFRVQLAHVEEEARQLISADAELIDQAGDINEEFYPEQPAAPQLAQPAQPAQVSAVVLTDPPVMQPAVFDVASTAEPVEQPRRGRKPKQQEAEPKPAAEPVTVQLEPERQPASMPVITPPAGPAVDLFN